MGGTWHRNFKSGDGNARFDEKFVQPLDLNDNTGEKNELASMIGMFNPVWDDDNSGSDAAFLEAVAVGRTDFGT